jgi:hypothetical protein
LELTWARLGSNAGSIDTTSPASCIPSLAEAQEPREHFTGEARALDREKTGKRRSISAGEAHHSTSSSHEAPGPHLGTCELCYTAQGGYAGRITQLTVIMDAIIHPANWHQMRYGWTTPGLWHSIRHSVRQVRAGTSGPSSRAAATPAAADDSSEPSFQRQARDSSGVQPAPSMRVACC